MSDEDDDQESGLDALVTFARAVYHSTTRWAALTDVALLVGKFAVPCLAIVVVVAVPQIHGLGLSRAWTNFGTWWILWPVMAGLVPIAFALARAAIEFAVRAMFWICVIPLYVIPAIFVGEERTERWLARAKHLPAMAFVGFVIWCAWVGGAESVAERHVHPTTSAASSIAWAALWHWLRTNPWVVLIVGPIGKVIAEIVKKWTATVADEITNPAPQRIVRIYAPDNRVVLEVKVDN